MNDLNRVRAEFEEWWTAPGEQFTDEEDIAWQAWQAATVKAHHSVGAAVPESGRKQAETRMNADIHRGAELAPDNDLKQEGSGV